MAQGFFAAQGLAACAAQGFLVAHGLAAFMAQGFLAAQGFFAAQGLATYAVVVAAGLACLELTSELMQDTAVKAIRQTTVLHNITDCFVRMTAYIVPSPLPEWSATDCLSRLPRSAGGNDTFPGLFLGTAFDLEAYPPPQRRT
jgi:hypothetical protein